jgi:hypothetical protein
MVLGNSFTVRLHPAFKLQTEMSSSNHIAKERESGPDRDAPPSRREGDFLYIVCSKPKFGLMFLLFLPAIQNDGMDELHCLTEHLNMSTFPIMPIPT